MDCKTINAKFSSTWIQILVTDEPLKIGDLVVAKARSGRIKGRVDYWGIFSNNGGLDNEVYNEIYIALKVIMIIKIIYK